MSLGMIIISAIIALILWGIVYRVPLGMKVSKDTRKSIIRQNSAKITREFVIKPNCKRFNLKYLEDENKKLIIKFKKELPLFIKKNDTTYDACLMLGDGLIPLIVENSINPKNDLLVEFLQMLEDMKNDKHIFKQFYKFGFTSWIDKNIKIIVK